MITIFTPTYNRADKLDCLYRSLLAQPINDFEWLIVDDGSNDNTKEVIDSFVNEKKLKIRYYYQENQGKYIALNQGFNLANGDYFICVDSDDSLSKDALKIMLDSTTKLSINDVGIIFPQSLNYEKNKNEWAKLDGAKIDVIDLKEEFGIIESALLIKTELLRKHQFPIFKNEDGSNEKFCQESVLYNQLIGEGQFLVQNYVVYNSDYLEDGLTSNLFTQVWENNFNATICDLKTRFKTAKKYKFRTRVKARSKAIMNLNALCLKKNKFIFKYTPSILYSILLFLPSVLLSLIRFKLSLNVLTLLFFFTGIFANTWGIPGSNSVIRIFMLLGGLLCLAKIIKTKIPEKPLILFGTMLAVTIFIYIRSGELSPFVTVVSLFCFYGIGFDQFVSVTMYFKIAILLLRLLLIACGVIENGAYSYWREEGMLRYDFGYSTANGIQVQLATVSFLALYKFRNLKIGKKAIVYALIAIINGVFFIFTKSRASIITMAFILLVAILGNFKWPRKVFTRLLVYALPFVCIFSIVGGLFYNANPFFEFIDRMTSYRLTYCNKMLSTLGISIFGCGVAGTDIIYDNSYVRILCNLGILYFAFIIGGMFVVSIKARKQKNFDLLLLLTAFQILAFAESIYGYFFANITLLLLTELFPKDEEKNMVLLQ